MADNVARRLLIYSSLFISGALFVFFIMAPPLGFPLTYEQAIRVLEIVLPVFLGYIGSASAYLFSADQAVGIVHEDRRQFLAPLLVGPVAIFLLVVVTILVSFGISNRSAAPAGEGMSVDMLAGAISAALGFLAVSTNLIAGRLFSK